MTYINLTPEVLAKIIDKAAQIREDSYDEVAADKATKTERFTESQAIKQAIAKYKVDPRFCRIIELSFYWWNDSLAWAEQIQLNEKQ